jgi:hypothetical protein
MMGAADMAAKALDRALLRWAGLIRDRDEFRTPYPDTRCPPISGSRPQVVKRRLSLGIAALLWAFCNEQKTRER